MNTLIHAYTERWVDEAGNHFGKCLCDPEGIGMTRSASTSHTNCPKCRAIMEWQGWILSERGIGRHRYQPTIFQLAEQKLSPDHPYAKYPIPLTSE